MSERWLPLDHPIPTGHVPGRWKVKPLQISDLDIDYEALTSSVEHLSNSGWLFPADAGIIWPLPTWTKDEALLAVAFDEMGNMGRCWMAFVAVAEDGSEEYGGIYVWPSFKEGYEAMLTMWTSAKRSAEMDDDLWAWVKEWVVENFPWELDQIAKPGREMSWEEWEALPDKMMPVKNILQFYEGSEVNAMT